MFPVSVIHSEVTRRITVYMVKPRGVHVVVFVLLNKSFYEQNLLQLINEACIRDYRYLFQILYHTVPATLFFTR